MCKQLHHKNSNLICSYGQRTEDREQRRHLARKASGGGTLEEDFKGEAASTYSGGSGLLSTPFFVRKVFNMSIQFHFLESQMSKHFNLMLPWGIDVLVFSVLNLKFSCLEN